VTAPPGHRITTGRSTAIALPPVQEVLKGLAVLSGRTGPLAGEAVRLTAELARVLVGTSQAAPHERDARFADPTWSSHPGYRRIMQAYVAASASLDALVADLEAGEADRRTIERARLARTVVMSTLAPTNTLLGNPSALKRGFETGGASVLRGLRNLLTDVWRNHGMPSQVDDRAFVVGRDTAITVGAVVQRDDIAELIQYGPTTTTVRGRPLVVVPPPISRFYFLDLRPGRSFVEYALSQGHQVFMLSWRNPGPEHAGWGIDRYAARVLSAYDAAAAIAGSEDVDTLGFCAGGLITTTVLNHLAVSGRADLVRSASLAVTLLDFEVPAPVGAFAAPGLLALAAAGSSARGLTSARALGAVFSWMRPDDLIFNYVVRNWLLGEAPPAFDILAWNADGTNLPARLHREFLDVFEGNKLVDPGALTVLGSPVDLGRIRQPMFVTGARTDHLTPWPGCYRTTQLVGGETTFALSSSGHIASLVNPPGNPRSSFALGPAGGTPREWEACTEARTGSWWEGWAEWVAKASPSEERAAPAACGGPGHPALDPAPGRYVRDQTP
jgi:polyhydroxyalkanoate synthase subunit PhaC